MYGPFCWPVYCKIFMLQYQKRKKESKKVACYFVHIPKVKLFKARLEYFIACKIKWDLVANKANNEKKKQKNADFITEVFVIKLSA